MAKVQKVLAMLDASFPEDVKAAIAKMTLEARPFYLPSWFMNKFVHYLNDPLTHIGTGLINEIP